MSDEPKFAPMMTALGPAPASQPGKLKFVGGAVIPQHRAQFLETENLALRKRVAELTEASKDLLEKFEEGCGVDDDELIEAGRALRDVLWPRDEALPADGACP